MTNLEYMKRKPFKHNSINRDPQCINMYENYELILCHFYIYFSFKSGSFFCLFNIYNGHNNTINYNGIFILAIQCGLFTWLTSVFVNFIKSIFWDG